MPPKADKDDDVCHSSEETLSSNSISNRSAKYILDLLKQGDQEIDFRSHRDIVLIIGNTGSGKTTLAQFLAGDNDHLISIKEGGMFGNFVIQDTDSKISTTTIESKTLFPELVFDTEANTAYVDTPGFSDNGRNEAYDIAAAYFVNKIFDTGKNVKIVLTANYQSLLKGANRNDFWTLLEHVTVLLKNIDGYINSVALVATKADNVGLRDGNPIRMPDEAILENVTDFLVEVEQSLKMMRNGGAKYTSLVQPVDSKLFYENSIKLLQALLTKEDSAYPRLGIFRRPDQPGNISRIQSLQNSKQKIAYVVQNLRYSPIDKADVGYSISHKSKAVVRDLVAEINYNIIADMAFINTDLISYYRDLESSMLTGDVYALRDRLQIASKALLEITGIGESTSAADLVTLMCINFTLMGVRVSKSRLCDIADLGKFLAFLYNVSAKKYESFTWKWIKELNEAVEYVANSFKWYNFLINLYDRLSEYDIQKKKQSYRVPSFEAIPEQHVFLLEESDEFGAFFEKISDANFLKIVNYEDVRKIRLDDMKIRFFHRLVQATIQNNDCEYTKKNQTLRVVGDYVLISEVKVEPLYESCESVQVFAKHTVFVDIGMTKINDISIIAPRWNIPSDQSRLNINQRPILRRKLRIKLDGGDASPHSPTKPLDGLWPGDQGRDGRPGMPGKSAGHFFGIGSVFTNLGNLTITANGGCGGPGEDGGHGADGQNGETFDVDNSLEFCSDVNQKSETKLTHETSYMFTLGHHVYFKYKNYGNPGGRGGNGGNGGAGGIGGHKGEVFTIDTSDKGAFSECDVIAHEGTSGPDGKPGQPGKGGEAGMHTELNCDISTWSNPVYCKSHQINVNNGDTGDIGAITEEHRRSPDTTEFLYPPSLTVCDYRNELSKNFNNCFKKRLSYRFYEELQSHAELNKYHNADTLLREFQHLEKYGRKFALDTTTKLYETIQKISQISPSPLESDQSHLLECLYLAATSKLHKLRPSPFNDYTIFELQEKFRETSESPSTSQVLKDTRFVSNTLDLLVENDLNPAIESVEGEIIELSHPLHEGVDDNFHKLPHLLSKGKLLSGLKTLTQFMSLLHEFVIADLQIIGEISIAEVFPSLKLHKIEITPEVKDSLKNTMQKFHQNVAYVIDTLTSIVSDERKPYQNLIDARTDIVDQLRSFERQLRSSVYTSAKSFCVHETLEKFSTFIEKLRALIQDEDTMEKEMIERMDTRRKLIEFEPQLYKKASRGNIEHLVEVLDYTGDFDKIKNSREEIESEIVSILRTVKAEIAVPYDPDKTSTTRKSLIDFMNRLNAHFRLIAKESDDDGNVRSIIENLSRIVNLLRNLYERVAFTELQIRLFRYQSWVRENQKQDQELGEFMRQDFLLHEYEHLVEIFKRSILPFDVLTPGTFPVPSIPDDAFQSVDNLEETLENNLNLLQSSLDTFTQNPPDKYTLEEYFDATHNRGPLFQWKHEHYAKPISDLLHGRTIVLTASVDMNDSRQFLRFASIQLQLRARDGTMQSSLDEALAEFNVHLTHSGNSSYMFCNHARSVNEKHSVYQHVYGDDAQADRLRSPYTMWLFSLHPVDQRASFRSLRSFVEQTIDLQLVGRAKYLNIENEQDVFEKFDIDTMDVDYSTIKGIW